MKISILLVTDGGIEKGKERNFIQFHLFNLTYYEWQQFYYYYYYYYYYQIFLTHILDRAPDEPWRCERLGEQRIT